HPASTREAGPCGPAGRIEDVAYAVDELDLGPGTRLHIPEEVEYAHRRMYSGWLAFAGRWYTACSARPPVALWLAQHLPATIGGLVASLPLLSESIRYSPPRPSVRRSEGCRASHEHHLDPRGHRDRPRYGCSGPSAQTPNIPATRYFGTSSQPMVPRCRMPGTAEADSLRSIGQDRRSRGAKRGRSTTRMSSGRSDPARGAKGDQMAAVHTRRDPPSTGASSRQHARPRLGHHVRANPSVAALYEDAVRSGEGIIAAEGPLVVRTGKHTGRSPQDKFIVREPSSRDKVWWGEVNRPISEEHYDRLRARLVDYLAGKTLFAQDCCIG